ncbi:hypothetical protein [Blastococcus saxobsidens]|uniref:MucR family transcriptional regulator n=1 Tax=Blastococcus saxobsidens (strain DD2) TaxID=1146883 RepID=H6RPY5_BLASD|nr:hypothetical protein [Blastococcus saxobsidens]CCG01554.1 conserved exported protein of unknown function, putative Enoyl-CoA hydratase domain [Blastococcus saxobsidens DD2]
MLHPVGPLPAAVYWRRRLTVLVVLLLVLGGVSWLTVSLVAGSGAGAAAASGTAAPAEVPALERVVPTVSELRTPATAPVSAPAPAPEPVSDPAPAGPTPGGPCTDDMLGLEVRTPGQVAVGTKPTFELVVVNTASVPCVRTLDKQLQELVMVDAARTRVWGSNDCFPESSSDQRILAPGEAVVFLIVWGGLTSEPTCTAPRVNPAPGEYVLRGRLDTKVSGDAPIVLG